MAKETEKNVSKNKLTDMSIIELVNYEKAARIICIKYEKSATAWGADTLRADLEGANEFQKEYLKYKIIYDKIIEEIERRLGEL